MKFYLFLTIKHISTLLEPRASALPLLEVAVRPEAEVLLRGLVELMQLPPSWHCIARTLHRYIAELFILESTASVCSPSFPGLPKITLVASKECA